MEGSLTFGRLWGWVWQIVVWLFLSALGIAVLIIGYSIFEYHWRFYQPRTALIQYVDGYEPLYQEMNRACATHSCNAEQLAVFLRQRDDLLAAAWPQMQSIMLPNWRRIKRPGESLIDGTIVRAADWSVRDEFVALVDKVGGPEIAFGYCVPIVYWQIAVPDTGMEDGFNGLKCGDTSYRLQQ